MIRIFSIAATLAGAFFAFGVQAFAAENRKITVVYDHELPTVPGKSVRGVLVEYGQSGGQPQPFDLTRLSGITGSKNRGSLWITWASASDYLTSTQALRTAADTLFGMVTHGSIQPHIAGIYPLCDAAVTHRLLESKATMGKLLLKVESL